MKIAYLILAHNTPNHLKRLVRALDCPNALFFIHVDRRSEITPFRYGINQVNIAFLNTRFDVYWDDFSKVDATIALIRKALKSPFQPDYFCLLSGSDYPLKSPRHILNFLSQNSGHEFINSVAMPCQEVQKPLDRIQQYWFQTPYDNRLILRVIARLNALNTKLKLMRRDYERVFDGLIPYAGSTWWALTREACSYILSFIDSKPDIVNFFRNTYMPDESLFQTIIGNSKFAKSITRNLTFTDWSRPSGGPAIIDMNHLKSFLTTECIIADDRYGRGELLFARKFPDDSAQLTDFIDTHLISRSDQAFGAQFETT